MPASIIVESRERRQAGTRDDIPENRLTAAREVAALCQMAPALAAEIMARDSEHVCIGDVNGAVRYWRPATAIDDVFTGWEGAQS